MFIGIDIGGTKCSVSKGKIVNGRIAIGAKIRLETADYSVGQILKKFEEAIDTLTEAETEPISAIGISCGGPLDSKRGLIQSPPNLPGWDDIAIVQHFEGKYHVAVALQNDANASALAEWKFGAGRGYRNVVFLTFGTGLGAGLILDGKLYSGTNDMAGEAGHIRLAPHGPVGYGKEGSFEGFCSGAGLAQIGRTKAIELLQQGKNVSYCEGNHALGDITAKSIADAADKGHNDAISVYETCAEKLGEGLSVLVDLLNPEVIILGSIFMRSQHLLYQTMLRKLRQESLPQSLSVCRVVPAELSENLGDYAALAVAAQAAEASEPVNDTAATHPNGRSNGVQDKPAICACETNSYNTENAGRVSVQSIQDIQGETPIVLTAETRQKLQHLFDRYPSLTACKTSLEQALIYLCETYRKGGKLLLCGNGGSSADCDHITGELMKGFLLPRKLSLQDKAIIKELTGEDGFADMLQYAYPAISLPHQTALLTAYANDISPEMVYAQAVFGYGSENDLLFAFSTSGNSVNVLNAVKAAKVRGMKTVGFTGMGGGKLGAWCDVTINVPETETYQVQELHLPVYHFLCAAAEHILFGEKEGRSL